MVFRDVFFILDAFCQTSPHYIDNSSVLKSRKGRKLPEGVNAEEIKAWKLRNCRGKCKNVQEMLKKKVMVWFLFNNKSCTGVHQTQFWPENISFFNKSFIHTVTWTDTETQESLQQKTDYWPHMDLVLLIWHLYLLSSLDFYI